ncbi:D-tyrosyl-tRNA(Tyr) deacylase (EC 3.6.1.n1) [Caballeronia sordidicola]|uniref:D-tyrosyl-tRNA(Tyr) deacylase n=1 Tax=Caballeronia sordidicola TaxID=196367 RepID=A0A226XAY4_CABSO|nr:D-tyrosyl-tRNA(Tyr) deacylase (EC 3.6.1.n1) [Caballeronia sordidicola]
MALLRVAVV